MSSEPTALAGCTIVTGATRGLGLEIASQLAEQVAAREQSAGGHTVLCTGRRESEGLRQLRSEQPCVAFRPLDLSETALIHSSAVAIAREFGPVRALVNNAAIAHDGVLATLHPRQIDEMLTVNLTGTILLTKAALRSMLIGGGGRVVNIASVVAHTGYRGLSVYGATKAGLLGFSRSLAREVGQADITVNVVSPGFLDTDMSSGLGDDDRARIVRRSPLGRLASTSAVAGAVLHLLGPTAADITGSELVVDAGGTA